MRKLLLSSALFLIPIMSFAHGDKPSFEKVVNGYLIDIGYDRVGIRPDEEVTFEFDLYTQSGALAFAEFSEVKIEIADEDGATTSEHTLQNKKEFIPTWKHTFTKGGMYQMHVDYLLNDRVLANAVFDVHVGENDGWLGRAMDMGTMIAAPLLVLFAAFIAVRSFMASRKKA
jgi:hypothetical protein